MISEGFVTNTMLLVFKIFIYLFLNIHSETNCISMLSVAVISDAVVADVYRVESSTYTDTLDLLKASGMALVKIEESKGPRQLPWGIPDSTWIML